jgi:hypothetical protein
MGWSVTEHDALARYAAEGLSASAIAKALGTDRTRNAILGRCHRTGVKLMLKPTPYSSGIGRRRKMRKPWRPKLTAAATVVEAGTAISPQLVVVPAEPSKPVRFMDLDNPQSPRMCRAIIGPVAGLDTLYCGKLTKAGSSWCPACRANCFDISATRRAFTKARLKGLAA